MNNPKDIPVKDPGISPNTPAPISTKSPFYRGPLPSAPDNSLQQAQATRGNVPQTAVAPLTPLFQQPPNAVPPAAAPAASTSSTSSVIDFQGPGAPLTGDSTDQTVYSSVIDAGKIAAGKGFKVTAFFSRSSGSTATIYNLFLGSALIETFTLTPQLTVNQTMQWTIFNNAGSTSSQSWARWAIFVDHTATVPGCQAGTFTADLSVSQILKFTFNVANPDQLTPVQWLIEAL